MDNRVNIAMYRNSYRNNKELMMVLYYLSRDMKRHHKNGEYITDFSPRTVSVCWTNSSDIYFTKYQRFGNIALSKIIDIKINNIRMFAILAFCLFNRKYNLESGLIDVNNFREKFLNNLDDFFDNDKDYYRLIFETDSICYYCDYIDKVNSN